MQLKSQQEKTHSAFASTKFNIRIITGSLERSENEKKGAEGNVHAIQRPYQLDRKWN